jgi:GNAT superfamily N-acetyltransferase
VIPLHEDPWFTFRFAEDRIIPRLHLDGVEGGRQVSVFKIDPESGEQLGFLATATVGEDGWVDLRQPIIVRAGEAFIAVPEREKQDGRSTMAGQFEVAVADACSDDATRLIAELSAKLSRRYEHVDDGSGHFRPEDASVPRSIFLIGRLDSRPVACGAVRPLVGDVGEVKRMYVDPAVRGRGLSKRLLAALEDAAHRMGYAALRLETGDRQPEAIRLYESAGYHRIEPFGIHIDSQRSVCFEKWLI